MDYNQRKTIKRFQIALRRGLVHGGLSKSHPLNKYINIKELRNKIESSFTPEMNWDNFAEIWEISHIVPVLYFDHTKETDIKLCWNIDNIIPMLKEDNKQVGSCLFFAKFWFDNNKSDSNYINLINEKISQNYFKYIK